MIRPGLRSDFQRKNSCLLQHGWKTSEHGFTLIELIVVMVLISTVTAFTLPKIRSSLFTNQLTATARQFIGLVAEVGQQARVQRIPVELRFDRKEHAFTTSSAGKNSGDGKVSASSAVRVPESVEVVDVATAGNGRKNQGDLVIQFSSRGYVDKTAVHLRDDDGEELTVILSPFLGVTRVLEGYVSLEEDRFSAVDN